MVTIQRHPMPRLSPHRQVGRGLDRSATRSLSALWAFQRQLPGVG